MKSDKEEKITDEMIGIDDKLCKCSSIVGDIIIAGEEKRGEKTSLSSIVDSIKKGHKEPNVTD